MNLALEVRGLTCIRGQRALFRKLDFAVPSGSLLCVEGPNGAGKTSLLRLIGGLLRPAAGIIRLRSDAGEVTEPEERGGFVGWLGHQDAVKPQMSVREQLLFFAQIYRASHSIDAALEMFGLAALAEVPGQFLSAGQKRRLALARLMLCGRPLWLLDEPLAALDAAGKKLVADTIRTHCTSGGVALTATHEPLDLTCETLRLGEHA